MNSPQGPDNKRTILSVAVLVLALLLLIFQVPVPLGLIGFLCGSAVGFFFLGEWIANRPPVTDNYAGGDDAFSRRVAERLTDCRRREERFRDEGEQILHSIATLRDDLSRNGNPSEEERTRAETVIKELEGEFSLRHAKASFFADCSVKLKELLDRHRLVESIAARRRELREMRQNNFDDEAAVEETRFSIEQDSIELDTIVELSHTATHSHKAEQTEDLRARLERLRSSLTKKESKSS